jgi:ribosomal protein S17
VLSNKMNQTISVAVRARAPSVYQKAIRRATAVRATRQRVPRATP